MYLYKTAIVPPEINMPFANVNGVKINYSVIGEGEPVILITGFGGDINFFHSLVPSLADKYKVIIFENRGAGLTEYNGDFTCQDLVDDVEALLDYLKVFKVHMLGWSMGSQIAMEFAIQHQERLQSLTLISAFEHCPARSSYMMNTMIENGLEGVKVEYIYAMVNAFSFTEEYFEAKRAKGQKVKVINTSTPEKLRQQMYCLDRFDLRGRLGVVKIPTLSIHGLDDIMVEPKLGDAVAADIPNCEVCRIPKVGHVIHPSLYADVFKEHLARNSKKS